MVSMLASVVIGALNLSDFKGPPRFARRKVISAITIPIIIDHLKFKWPLGVLTSSIVVQ